MKKLSRHKSQCLSGFTLSKNTWEDVPKDNIWTELNIMQNEFCAYCECTLNRKHIEHFKPRNAHPRAYPNETFNWNNLFGSCGDSSKPGGWNRCGIYKDNSAGAYEVKDIIKPDAEDPNHYLLFLTSGSVVSKPNLTNAEQHKADETIRVFNLDNDSKLVNSRKQAIKAIEPEVEALYEMLGELDKADWLSLLSYELSKVSGCEFQTALEHTLSYKQSY